MNSRQKLSLEAQQERITRLRQTLADVQTAHLHGDATHQAVTAARRRLEAALQAAGPSKGELSDMLYRPPTQED